MAKVGICFPSKDFLKLSEEEFVPYLKKFQQKGLYSFDMYTEFLLKQKLINTILQQMQKHNIKVSLHYQGDIPKDNEQAIMQVKEQLKAIRQILDSNGHCYEINIVFHVPDYQKNKYAHLNEMIVFFQTITTFAEDLKFNILIEILSNNHPAGNHLGNDFSEISIFLNNIDNENFGVCWDLGHTRLNHLENKELLLVPAKIIDRIKFVHVHNAYQKKDGKYIEHIPLTDLKLQSAELKFLIENNYKGIYSLEYGLDGLSENVNIYLDNIKKLNKFIEKNKEERK